MTTGQQVWVRQPDAPTNQWAAARVMVISENGKSLGLWVEPGYAVRMRSGGVHVGTLALLRTSVGIYWQDILTGEPLDVREAQPDD